MHLNCMHKRGKSYDTLNNVVSITSDASDKQEHNLRTVPHRLDAMSQLFMTSMYHMIFMTSMCIICMYEASEDERFRASSSREKNLTTE